MTLKTQQQVKLSAHHLPKSSFIVFCRLAMLASRAARPSLNAASSLVSKVEPDLTLHSDVTDSTSHWESVESNKRLRSVPACRPHGWTSELRQCDWWRSGCDDVCSAAFPSLSACCSSWSRDIRYWLMRSVGGCGGSCLCCCVAAAASDTQLPTSV